MILLALIPFSGVYLKQKYEITNSNKNTNYKNTNKITKLQIQKYKQNYKNMTRLDKYIQNKITRAVKQNQPFRIIIDYNYQIDVYLSLSVLNFY